MVNDEFRITRGPPVPPPRGDRRRAVAYVGSGIVVLVVIAVLLVVLIDSAEGGVVEPGWLDEEPSGEVVYCSGEDVSRSQARSVADFNGSAGRGTARAELADDIPPKADAQYKAYLDRMDKGECDVLYLDVVYTPEFASRDLLFEMTPYLENDGLASSFDPRMMRTVASGDRLWGVPKQLDGGVLYYRRDTVRPPRTWPGLAAAAEPDPGEQPRLRVQLDAFEGLTVTFLELAYAAGADPIISDDGKTANLDQPGTLEALRFLRSAIRRGAVPRSVTRQGDTGSRWAFGVGRAKYLRSWPYVEARLEADAAEAERTGNRTAPARRRTADNLGVVSLPPWTPNGSRVGVLGGHNLVIPRTAKNPRGALHLIRFLTSEDQILRDARQASQAPVLPDLWDHEDVRRSPALMAVRDEDLRLRPILTNYRRISRVIYTALRRVLRNVQSEKTFPAELRSIEADVQSELAGGQ